MENGNNGDTMETSNVLVVVRKEEDSLSSSLERWNKWMPMNDINLFRGVRTLQLCMLQKLDEMLTNANIKYWICGGTLLGAIRHNGFIPHDDDIDIEINISDLKAIANIPFDPPFYTGFIQDASKWEGHMVSHLNFFYNEFIIDVFPRQLVLTNNNNKNHNDVVVDDEIMKHFPSYDEIFPLQKYQFHNIHVYGPCKDKCVRYLNRLYGNDWNNTVCVWNHDYNYYYLKSFHHRKEVLHLFEYNKVITEAGITSPVAEVTANETFQNFCNQYNAQDKFLQDYKNYISKRTYRWNQADAEWRYEQQQQQQQQQQE